MEFGCMHRPTYLVGPLVGVAFLVSGCGGSSETTQTGAGGVGNGTGGGGAVAGSGSGGSQAAGGSGGPAGVAGTSGSPGGAGGLGGSPAGAGGSSAGRGGVTGGTPGTGGAISTGGSESYPVPAQPPADEDGSELWLRYKKVALPSRLAEYQAALTHVVKAISSETLQAAQAEVVKGFGGLLGATIAAADAPTGDGAVVLGTPTSSTLVSGLSLGSRLTAVGSEGYLVEATTVAGKKAIVVAGNSDVGVLRGAFALLRHLQMHRTVAGLSLSGAPKIKRRILNHWDNLDGTVERGYAGRSLWAWSSLPATISQRYKDYARANASIGINGAVLTNVNANAQVLTSQYLDKVAALASVFRVYGIAVYLTARFSAPSEIGGLSTNDPASSAVQQWWKDKVTEIYTKIPDFGGFLVKANSEGQPGPQTYNRTHADGAKMLSDALAGKGGVVLWRAFVYSDGGTDRIRQAYDEFKPLDGKFGANALVQVKNGPLDFQPREPFSPLFGAMPSTPLALELQITKEYLGEDTHLAYLGPLYEEVLKSDTYAKGAGSTVARVVDGTVHGYTNTAISGVANIGTDANWTGSHFNQANWYVYGRMAWDPDVTAQAVADEWVRQTFTNDPAVVDPVVTMMMGSRQTLVNYMTPLGLAHIMGTDDHYGPAPWVSTLSTANWNPVYYHKADATGIGFDRTATGSNAVSQYAATVRDKLASKTSIPDDLLLFFQRVGWDDKLASSGRTVWEEMVHRYSLGVDGVQTMRDAWMAAQGRIDAKRFKDVADFLQIQHYEARWWRDACLLYFASLNKKAIPSGYATPGHDLTFFKGLESSCPSDVTKPRCSSVYSGTPSPAITK
jgi:alpha-glucuronidase